MFGSGMSTESVTSRYAMSARRLPPGGSVEEIPQIQGLVPCQLLPGRVFGSGLSVTSIR